MINGRLFFIAVLLNAATRSFTFNPASYDRGLEGLTDGFLKQVLSRIQGSGLDLSDSSLEFASDQRAKHEEPPLSADVYQRDPTFGAHHLGRYRKENGDQAQQVDILGGPSIRDQEYLQHSSLWGHQYVTGGAGEGFQRLKPDGIAKNVQVVKTDAVLPAYCNPPNPCPKGYTAEDGCLEKFENTAAYSRDYQAAQDCMCDTEHMFDCPGATQENEIDALARSIQNEGLMESTLDRIVQHIDPTVPVEGQHKTVMAKKFFKKENHASYAKRYSRKSKKSVKQPKTTPAKNPYLQGEKLPVVAKKAPLAPRK
ncbi:secretogranin_V domain-containing protein 7B2 [Rhipicephalus microplus]|uniref:secretogranin_V domain-containing protein 7B2 n=1 Tax=Rhipicephalus microplus TaxID=6941 RepID=UPI003F6C1FC7